MGRSSRRDSIVSLGYGLMRLRAATRAARLFLVEAQLHHIADRAILQNGAKPQVFRAPSESCRSAFNVCMGLRFAEILWSKRESRAHSELANAKGAASTLCPGMAIRLGPAASDSSPNADLRCWQKHESEINVALWRPPFRRQLYPEREIYKVPVES